MYCDDIRSAIRKPECFILSMYFTVTTDINAVTVFVEVLL